MVKRSFAALFSLLFVFALCVPFVSGAAGDKELILMCEKGSVQIENMHWRLYRIGERGGSGFVLTGRFADYPVSVRDINEDNVRGTAQALESFVTGDSVAADADGYTDINGTVSFTGLDAGLYLAVPEKVRVDKLEYRSVPLLAEIIDGAETVFPKMYSSIVAGAEVRDLTVKKVWSDQDNISGSRPESITVELFGNGVKTDTVTLDSSNGWKYRWTALATDTEWRVVERNVPAGYTVLLDMDSDQFLIRNTLENPEPPVTTTTTSSTVTTTITGDSRLPQTGQLWWPVFALSIGGIVFIAVGLLLKRFSDKNEE